MKTKQFAHHTFLLRSTLIALSIFAVFFIGLSIYTFVFYTETQTGLENYFSDTFAIFPFALIYAILTVSSLILLLAVVLMWLRKKLGLFIYLSWSFAMVLLLLFADQIDWFNIVLLLVLSVVLLLHKSYFSIKQEEHSIESVVSPD